MTAFGLKGCHNFPKSGNPVADPAPRFSLHFLQSKKAVNNITAF
jgi:hypothetical protein